MSDTGCVRHVADDLTVLDLIDGACQRPAHVHADVDNVHVRPAGNSAERALRRLRSQRPDLHAKVLTGELLLEMEKQAGSRGIGKKVDSSNNEPASTLKKLGISPYP